MREAQSGPSSADFPASAKSATHSLSRGENPAVQPCCQSPQEIGALLDLWMEEDSAACWRAVDGVAGTSAANP